jgi:serine/threonine protein phosphatase PrpC
MEDSHNICLPLNEKGLMLFGVYDGHGGKLAAQFMNEVVPGAFKNVKDTSDTENIKKIMLELDQTIMAKGVDDGTTVCMVIAEPWDHVTDSPISLKEGESIFDHKNGCLKCLSINLGDSRAMIVRSNGKWVAMTRDHKPNDEIERQRIINAYGHVSSNRVDGNLALSRAIGDAMYKNNPKLGPEEQKVIAVPDYETHFLYPGDVLLVCCDGIFESEAMTYEAVASIAYDSICELSNNGAAWDPAVVARNLIEQSLLKDSRDNHTAMVIHFADGKDYTKNLPTKEVIPGPYHKHCNDNSFETAYVDDLKANGYTLQDVLPALEQVEGKGNAEGLQAIVYENAEEPAAAGRGFNVDMMNHFIQLLSSNPQGFPSEEEDEM